MDGFLTFGSSVSSNFRSYSVSTRVHYPEGLVLRSCRAYRTIVVPGYRCHLLIVVSVYNHSSPYLCYLFLSTHLPVPLCIFWYVLLSAHPPLFNTYLTLVDFGKFSGHTLCRYIPHFHLCDKKKKKLEGTRRRVRKERVRGTRGRKREEYLIGSRSNEDIVGKWVPVNVHETLAVTTQSSSGCGDVLGKSSLGNGIQS